MAQIQTALATLAVVGLFVLAPDPAAAHNFGEPEVCHTHEDVQGEHCHIELPLADNLVDAPHPLSVTVDRVTRVVAGVVSVRPPLPSDSDIGICRNDEDCPSREKCVGGYCIERSFQPLGTVFDSLQMSLKTGGPGAALRLRW